MWYGPQFTVRWYSLLLSINLFTTNLNNTCRNKFICSQTLCHTLKKIEKSDCFFSCLEYGDCCDRNYIVNVVGFITTCTTIRAFVSLITICNRVYLIQYYVIIVRQWLQQICGFSSHTPVFSTNKTDRYDITEIFVEGMKHL